MLPKAAVICALLALFSAGSQSNKEANVHSKFGCVIITQKIDYKMGIFSTFKSRYLSPGMAHL